MLAALLALLSVGTYLSWFAEEPDAVRRVTLIDAPTAQLERLVLETPTATAAISMKTDPFGERYPWIHHEMGERERWFVGGERIDDALERMFPLKAERSLGDDLTEDELAGIGLSPPAGRLVAEFAGRSTELEVGLRTGGTDRGDYYVRRPGDEEVFLVSGRDLENAQRPDRGRQRTIRTTEKRDVARVHLEQGGRALTVLQQNRTAPDAFWALESAPETRSDEASQMIETIFRLTVTEFPEPEPADPRGVVRFRWVGPDGDELGWAELAEAAAGEDGSKEAFFVRSPETHRWGRVSDSLGRRIADQASELMATPED